MFAGPLLLVWLALAFVARKRARRRRAQWLLGPSSTGLTVEPLSATKLAPEPEEEGEAAGPMAADDSNHRHTSIGSSLTSAASAGALAGASGHGLGLMPVEEPELVLLPSVPVAVVG